MQLTLNFVRGAIEKYDMIQHKDRIAIGVSGGKDSMMLLYGMARMKKILMEYFDLTALTVDPCFGGKPTDYSEVQALCKELKIPYVIRRTRLAEIIFEERKEKNPCSLCSKMRRGILHNMAVEAGCNKIALGHHYDDAAETIFLNLFYGGRFSCFSPKTYLSKKNIWVIRPMIYCSELSLAEAAKRNNLPIVQSSCPADGNTQRQYAKDFLAEMQHKIPWIKDNLVGAMERGELCGWKKDSEPKP